MKDILLATPDTLLPPADILLVLEDILLAIVESELTGLATGKEPAQLRVATR